MTDESAFEDVSTDLMCLRGLETTSIGLSERKDLRENSQVIFVTVKFVQLTPSHTL